MIFESFQKAGYLDQSAHTLAGILITIFYLKFGIIWWLSIILTMIVAFIREMIQHPFCIPAGSRTDLLFWLIGCIIGELIMKYLVG